MEEMVVDKAPIYFGLPKERAEAIAVRINERSQKLTGE